VTTPIPTISGYWVSLGADPSNRSDSRVCGLLLNGPHPPGLSVPPLCAGSRTTGLAGHSLPMPWFALPVPRFYPRPVVTVVTADAEPELFPIGHKKALLG